MAKVTLAVATVVASLPTGITAGALRFTIKDSNGNVVQVQDVAATTAVFVGVAEGSYIGSVVRLDTNGADLGDTLTAVFTVDAAPVVVQATYDAPASLTVTVEAE